MLHKNKWALLLPLILAIMTIVDFCVPARTPAQQGPPGCTIVGSFGSCDPNQLGANAIALPISSQTALTNIIDMRGVKEATLMFSCGQIADLQADLYQEDGATVQIGPLAVATAFAATANSVYTISSEADPTSPNGTIGSNKYRLPLRAISFRWNNTTASGSTCTARLFLNYH